MAVNTNRRIQAPFQPLLGEQSVATHVDKGFVEEGVVDNSTGALISAVGNNAISAYEGYQVADTEQKVKDTVEAYTGVTVDPEEERMEGKLNRLVNGRINGGMSELEFRMRVENAVKAGIATMPGRASVFRKAAAEVLGDNDAAIDYTIAQQKAAKAVSDKFLQDMQTHFNVSAAELTGPKAAHYQQEYAEFAAAVNMSTKASALENVAKLGKAANVREVAVGASAHATVQAHKFRRTFEDLQVNGGKSVSQLRAEGMSDEDIVKTIAGDEQGRRDLARSMSIEIRRAKEEMRQYFNTQAMARGINLSEFSKEIEAQESLYDGLLSTLDQGTLDSDRLYSLVNSLVKRDQGITQSILGQNTAGLFMGNALSEAMELYFTNPEYARQRLGPQGYAILEQITATPGGRKSLVNGVNNVATGRTSATALAEIDPDLAYVVNSNSIQTILDVNKNGFPEKTKLGEKVDTDQLKEIFVNDSVSVLGTIDVANKESIKRLKDIFGPAYGKRLAELPNRLQRRVTNVLKDKYDSVLGSKSNPQSVLGRLFAAEERHAKTRDAQPKGEPRGKEPNLWVEIKNGELIHSDNSLRAPFGRRDQPRITDGTKRYDFARSRDVVDHIAAVKDANLFLESRYEAATLLGEKRTWDQYLNDFYEEAYLGTKPGYGEKETEKIEEGANDTSANSTNYRKLVDAVAGGTVGGK